LVEEEKEEGRRRRKKRRRKKKKGGGEGRKEGKGGEEEEGRKEGKGGEEEEKEDFKYVMRYNYQFSFLSLTGSIYFFLPCYPNYIPPSLPRPGYDQQTQE